MFSKTVITFIELIMTGIICNILKLQTLKVPNIANIIESVK